MTTSNEVKVTKSNTWISLGSMFVLISIATGLAWEARGARSFMESVSGSMASIDSRLEVIEDRVDIAIKGEEVRAAIEKEIAGYVRLLQAENKGKDVVFPDYN